MTPKTQGIYAQRILTRKQGGFAVETPPDLQHSVRDRRPQPPRKRLAPTERQIGGSEPGDSPDSVSVPNAIEAAEVLITQWLLYESLDLVCNILALRKRESLSVFQLPAEIPLGILGHQGLVPVMQRPLHATQREGVAPTRCADG